MVEPLTTEPFTMESMKWVRSGETSLAVTLLGGVGSLTVIVIAVMLCTKCREHKQTTDAEMTLNEEKSEKKSKKEKSSKKAKQKNDKKNVDVHDVELGVETGSNHAQTNGKERPLSHDHRALPDIPNYGMISTDEEETDPGHYDVIGARKRDNKHAYDKIRGEADTDSGGYAGIKDPTYSKVKGDEPSTSVGTADPGYAGIKDSGDQSEDLLDGRHDYSLVEQEGAEYAQININPNRRSRVGTSERGEDTLSTNPPVPDRNYSDDGQQSLLPENSPNLPPRNSAEWAGMAANGAAASMPPPNGASVGLTDITLDRVGGNGAASGPEKKKGPDYSKVTARISLDELKKRQELEMGANNMSGDNGSATYASVDYDQIRSPGASGAVAAGDRNSMTSDLYAEIAGSTRSSTYARVGELNQGAPTPPPIDTMKVSLIQDDDEPEPGYSRISRPGGRPMSAIGPADGRRSPVYAVVDKSKKRQTVHGPLDSGDHNMDVDSMYSKVNKQKPSMSSMGVVYDNHSGGATSGAITMDPDYTTIGSALDYDPDYDQVRDPPSLTPAIATMDEFDDDPNYAQLSDTISQPVTSVASTSAALPCYPGSNSQPVGSSGQNRPREVANGTMVLMNQQSQAPVTWTRREHIYQEIRETDSAANNGTAINHNGSMDTML